MDWKSALYETVFPVESLKTINQFWASINYIGKNICWKTKSSKKIMLMSYV